MLEKDEALIPLSPIDYVRALKEAYKEDFKNTEEFFLLLEEAPNGLFIADWKYKYSTSLESDSVIFREAVFLHEDYAVRIRFATYPLLYNKFEPVFLKIMESISVGRKAKMLDRTAPQAASFSLR
jgi:hypothetical protein